MRVKTRMMQNMKPHKQFNFCEKICFTVFEKGMLRQKGKYFLPITEV